MSPAKRAHALEHLEVEVAHGFRHRTAFAECRGSRSRSKRSRILFARIERERLRVLCTAIRALRG